MSSTHYMAHLLRTPPSITSSSIQQSSVAVLLTLTHLICHIACVSPSSAAKHVAAVEHARLNASSMSSPSLEQGTKRRRKENDRERNQSTLIIMSEDDDDVGDMERTFAEFLTMFNITFNEDVDFVRGEGLSTLLWHSEHSNYASVLYVLSRRNFSEAGLCDMSESMSLTFNKTIIIWPCPNMKSTESQPALPSYETFSFAVKSISQEFNWTEAVIFVAGTNWGLPLAIAANLHVPYRIEFNCTNAGQIEDKLGTAVILTSPVDSIYSKGLLIEFRSFLYTKVLVIDVTGAIFSNQNHFSGYLTTKGELDYIFEHWSEHNYYSTSKHENDTRPRGKRSAEGGLDIAGSVDGAGELVRANDSRSEISANPEQSETNSKRVQQEFLVDPKPQNFLILTVLTEKFKTLHNAALHVEFEQYHKLSRSSVVEPLSMRDELRRGESEVSATSEEASQETTTTMEGARTDGRNIGNTDRYQLHRRRQMKRSEEIIVTVNGTRNCNTATVHAERDDGENKKSAALEGREAVEDGPKSEGDSGDGCTENKRNGDNDKDEEEEGAEGRLLISKLPIFTSLTSSINESIQLLLVYMEEKNCTPSMRPRSEAKEVNDDASPLAECVSALNCPRVTDANEQLFCNYLCQVVMNYTLTGVDDVDAKKNVSVSSNGTSVSGGRGDAVVTTAHLDVIVEVVSRRFASEIELVTTAELICRQLSQLSRRNESSGRIQVQFSENLLYFYNENVVSKNNELVKRRNSKQTPNQQQQSQKSQHLAMDYPFSNSASHRLLKRYASVASTPTSSAPLTPSSPHLHNNDAPNGSQRHPGDLDKRHADDSPDMTVTVGNAGDNDDDVDSAPNGHRNALTSAASHYAKYNEYISLFDYIVATVAAAGRKDREAAGASGSRVDFIILDFQNVISPDNETGLGWRPFLIMQQNGLNPKAFTTYSILPGYSDWTLVPTQIFMDCGLLCMGVIALAVLILCTITVGGIASAITMRNYLLKKRLSKGPNKVVLSPVDFVFPVDSRRVDEGIEAMLCCFLQQLQEFGGPEVEKPDVVKGSISSLKTAGLATAQNKNNNNSGSGSLVRHNTVLDMRARYNGDLVQLKEIAMLTGTELKTKAMDHLVMTHGLRHENINPFIGWLSDSNRTAMVFEYCSRGSLQDVLIMDDIKLDWSFRLSLLTDLVRGMRYLHSSPLRVHGGLTSRNCVVDARWVLKITDYGMSSFYDTIGITAPTKSAKELLWTAPEALRNTKGFPKCGTQMGDVYSFAIIMQEVVVRGEPYCMLSLSPEEIIAKIKKPPPLIRPSVSKGAAPPEAINIMRQCWAEMPDMRPDFNTVYERFKQLNHGRKVNFVDTMFQMLEKYSNNLEELIRERTDQLDMERKKTEQLLNRMLPNTVAEKLKVGLGVEPEEFSEVTIYFSDIVGFTTIAAHCSPVQVVDLLNDLYTCFDATINAYNVYKVETIGDAYMVVSGLPSRIPDHAEQIATMALDLLHESGRFRIKHLPGVPLQLRIGLHSGPCCAGVVGLTMPRYCLFGDTVNTASRMESTGSSWRIHLSLSTRDRLVRAGGYHIDSRGLIEIKGKGMMNTYWLLGKKGFEKPLPVPPPIGESHGLDESLIRNSIRTSQLIEQLSLEGDSATLTSTNKSDVIEVTVEITPPAMTNAEMPQYQQQHQHQQLQHYQQQGMAEPGQPVIATSLSLDSSGGQATLSFSQQDFPPRASVSLASPQQRKMSEFSQDSLLNPTGFTRMTPSPGANSSRLFKKIEEMMDLSSPYNHYRCLSSESSLAQCGGNMLGLGSALQNLATLGGNLSVPTPAALMNTFSTNLTVPETTTADGGKLNATRNTFIAAAAAVGGSKGSAADEAGCLAESVSRPGSGRLLRRQFSLDKDDVNNNNSATSATLSNNLGNSACFQAGGKSYLDRSPAVAAAAAASVAVPPVDGYQKHSSLPSISGQTLINKLQQTNNRTALFKHNSSSISQDLEKIEEIPGSPNHPFDTLSFAEQPPRLNHAPYSQSSLTNSIPYIDGSCSSSVSTIPSSATAAVAAASGAVVAGHHPQMSSTTGSRMTLVRESSGGETKAHTDGGDEGKEAEKEEFNAVAVEGRREMNLNVDPLPLLR